MELIKAMGLDPQAPYLLGNTECYYVRKCNSGHDNLTDEEIKFAGGVYDGYDWVVPVCMRCIFSSPDNDKRVGRYIYHTPYHLGKKI